MRIIKFLPAVALLTVILACTQATSSNEKDDLPKGWFKAGSEPEKYVMGVDKKANSDGSSAAYIESTKPVKNGFGTMMQSSSAKEYLGKKVKMTGSMKSENVDGWAGLWLRIDGHEESSLSFDNMGDRPVKGTSDWKNYEIVLDVPKNSATLNYGALLAGTGKIWFDNVEFEAIADSANVPTTGSLSHPTNTSFEE